jgi:hypothetical protein
MAASITLGKSQFANCGENLSAHAALAVLHDGIGCHRVWAFMAFTNLRLIGPRRAEALNPYKGVDDTIV